jgi:hypothetical protein
MQCIKQADRLMTVRVVKKKAYAMMRLGGGVSTDG